MRTVQVISEIEHLISTFKGKQLVMTYFKTYMKIVNISREGDRGAREVKGQRFYFFIVMIFHKKFPVIRLLLTNQSGTVKNLVFNSAGTQLLGSVEIHL